MNTTALRALVLVVNLALWSLVSWMSYLTFRYTDLERWDVEVPRFSRFIPPPLEEDPLAGEREVYNTIAEVFALPTEAPAPEAAKPAEPVKPTTSGGDTSRLVVVMSNVAPDGSRMHSTVMLRPPGAATEKPFTEGMALDSYMEFAAYPGVKVQKITPEAVVLVDKTGKEVGRLDSKPKGRGR